MLSNLQNNQQKNFAVESNKDTANQSSVEKNLCQEPILEESSQDIVTIGSKKRMSYQERYEFVKNRTYSAVKPSSGNQ